MLQRRNGGVEGFLQCQASLLQDGLTLYFPCNTRSQPRAAQELSWAALSMEMPSRGYCMHCSVFVVWHIREAACQLLLLQCRTANALEQCDADHCQTTGTNLCSRKGREVVRSSATDRTQVGHCMVPVRCGCGLPVSSNLFLWGSGLPC